MADISNRGGRERRRRLFYGGKEVSLKKRKRKRVSGEEKSGDELYWPTRGNDKRQGMARVSRFGCLQTPIIVFVTRVSVEVVAIGRNGNGERVRWSSLYHLTDAADTTRTHTGLGERS